jgi:putative PIN family toxin of toxin-antitoxin system
VIRVVLDTNVLMSAAINPKGTPAQVLAAWRDGAFALLVSQPILEELDRVSHYPKLVKYHQWPDQRIRNFIVDLKHLAILTPGKTQLSVIEEDPSDNRYLECAVEGKADCIVSGDQHLLELEEYQDVRIVNPRAFLDLVSTRSDEEQTTAEEEPR